MDRERISKISGFTLLELLIGLLIASILLSAAAPSFLHLYRSTQANMVRNQLSTLLSYCRYTALARRQTITICPATDTLTCGTDWAQGMIVFADANENGERDGNENVLRSTPALETGSQLTWRAFRGKPYLQFTSSGVTKAQNGRFSYCPPGKKKDYWRQLIVHKSGRVRYAAVSELTDRC